MILGVLKAFIEGLIPQKSENRPIGLKHFDYFSNDELLNQLAEPLFKHDFAKGQTSSPPEPAHLKAKPQVAVRKNAPAAFSALPPSTSYGMGPAAVKPVFKV